jgi:sucrose-6F-phosphate phosphohydrolase
MPILATDLDRTLLPNGHWPADDGAIDLFNRLTREHGITVVYVTGRNLDLTERAIVEYGIRYPELLIGDVGTTIRRRTADAWERHDGWDAHVRAASPRWDVDAVRAALTGIDGLVEQEAVHCGPFKQSYYADHAARERILDAVGERVRGHFDEILVYSHDSQTGKGLLDVLPDSATKQTALEFIADELEVAHDEVVFCGDSGNDIHPLTAGFRGVMVRNADAQLVDSVQAAAARDPRIQVYHAQGGSDGLSGYYTSGVIEGARHYGLFNGPA